MADNPLAQWLAEQEQRVPASHAGPPRADGAATGDDATSPTGPTAPPPVTGGAPAGWWDVPADGEAPARRPRRRLLIAALLPWLLVAGLAVAVAGRGAPVGDEEPEVPAGGAGDEGPEMSAGRVGSDGTVAEEAVRAGRAPGDGPAAPALTDSASGGVVPASADPAVQTAAAVAVLEFRAAAGRAPSDDAPARFVEDAVATDVERIGDGVVVTLRALVLEGDREGWRSAGTSDWAVALRAGPGGPTLSAGPWPLPEPSTPPVPPADAEPGLAAPVAQALEDAGFREAQDVRVVRDPALPGVLVAQATAVGPAGGPPGAHVVWLRDAAPPVLVGGRDDPAGPGAAADLRDP